MLSIPSDALNLITGSGTILDAAPAIPLGVAIGAAAGSSSGIEAAGGLVAFKTLGASLGGIAAGGLVASGIAGWTIGSYIGEQAFVREKLSEWLWDVFGDD